MSANPDTKKCVGIKIVSPRQGHSGKMCQHLAVVATCCRHVGDFLSQGQRLLARKIVEHFGCNCGVWPFYAACCCDELSRGSVSCLLNTSFEKQFRNAKLIFWAKIYDQSIHRGDTGWILAQWQGPMASRVVIDLLYWVMCLASHLQRRCICSFQPFFLFD